MASKSDRKSPIVNEICKCDSERYEPYIGEGMESKIMYDATKICWSMWEEESVDPDGILKGFDKYLSEDLLLPTCDLLRSYMLSLSDDGINKFLVSELVEKFTFDGRYSPRWSLLGNMEGKVCTGERNSPVEDIHTISQDILEDLVDRVIEDWQFSELVTRILKTGSRECYYGIEICCHTADNPEIIFDGVLNRDIVQTVYMFPGGGAGMVGGLIYYNGRTGEHIYTGCTYD